MANDAAFDLLIRGAQVVGDASIQLADVGVRDGLIAAVLPPGTVADAERVLDLPGRLLLPGLVDAHVHLREPGMTDKEDFQSGTRAAAVGGVTTVLVMPTDNPWTVSAEQLSEKIGLAEGRLHVDAAFQVAAVIPLQDIDALSSLGAVSLEVFTSDVAQGFRHDTLERLLNALAPAAHSGMLVGFSPGDQSLLDAAERMPGTDAWAFTASRPAIAEGTSIALAITAAARSGAKVHIRQTNSALGLEIFRRLKSLADVSIETTPQCFLFTEDDYASKGAVLKASPPLRSGTDRDAVLNALRDGTIDTVVTDHAPHTDAEKFAGYGRFADIPGGFPGLETLLPAMLHLVARGILSLPDVVRLCAAGPAKRFGLGHRKGSIAPGHDADIVVIDPSRSTVADASRFSSKSRHSPFDGLQVPYAIERVMLRGQDIAVSGRATSDRHGRVLTRFNR